MKVSSLAGKLLIAMPNMGDPRFYRAVIFLCAHDAQGAMGLTINQPLPGLSARQLFDQLQIKGLPEADAKALEFPIYSGGPVETSRGFLLHSLDFRQRETVPVVSHFGVTGTIDALIEIARGRGPQNFMFMLGYSGWGAGQLDKEMQENAWLVVEPDAETIFTTPPAEKWAVALGRLGVDPLMLSGAAGRA
ncbi:MAG: YqgE/AlgH family protein [Alphaproteobacteria bacterium]|nr:YqgE/AlgH family protein [Alphaproteobacteria bacterium]